MKTSTIIIAVVIILLVIAGFALSMNGSQTGATPSPTVSMVGATPTPQVFAPGVPNVVTASDVSVTETTAVVTGTVTPNGAFTDYWYEFGPTTSLGHTTAHQTVGSGYALTETPAYITGLTKDTRYYFRLVAENQFGKISGNQYSFDTKAGNPQPVGSAPVAKTIAADSVSRNTANVHAEVTPNGATTQYWFEYGTTPNLGNTTAFVSAGNGTSMTAISQSLSDLDPLTTYYFRINAQNRFGTVNGAILNFKTAGPGVQIKVN